MVHSDHPAYARPAALLSGVVGLVGGLVLVAYFALASPYDNDPGGPNWLGPINDTLGVVQFAALAPVAWALGRRLPVSRGVRLATLVAVAASIAAAVLGAVLVAGVLTFEQQIGPLMGAILCLYGWLLVINLSAHRSRSLPRVVTRVGILLGISLPVGVALFGASYLLPGLAGSVVRGLSYAVGGAAWLGLPVYPLLLAARVFTGPVAPPADDPRPVLRKELS